MPEFHGGSAILRAITAPVVLFGLLILVIGATTSSIGIVSNLPDLYRLWITLGAGVLLLIITVMVFVLTWYKPTNLIYSEHGHLEEHAMVWGALENRVDKEALTIAPRQPRIREHQGPGEKS